MTPTQIRKILSHRGSTIAWLAGELGISRQRLSNYLIGKRAMPSDIAKRSERILRRTAK